MAQFIRRADLFINLDTVDSVQVYRKPDGTIMDLHIFFNTFGHGNMHPENVEDDDAPTQVFMALKGDDALAVLAHLTAIATDITPCVAEGGTN